MKKTLILLMCLVLTMGVFTACGKKDNGIKTGLAVITSIGSSKDAGEKEGLAQADSTAAAVIIDEKGVIINCVIDVVQTKINFSTTGEITTDLAAEFVSKHELGDAYDMRKASPIGKEWDEQAAALSEYVIGKTLDEVKGIAIDESGYPTSEDLTSSVTMNVGSMLEAVEKAVGNAKSLGASADDKLGLGIISRPSNYSTNAGDKDGSAQADTHYGVVTLNADGKITSSIIEASQAKINFTNEGKITSDLAATFQTKTELGDAYNMREASPIKKEWNEQAKAFADYIVGKTIDEVKGIAINEKGAPTSEDLTSSVTVDIGDFLTAVEKACATAK